MLRTLWFVSEQLGAPLRGKAGEGDFLPLQRKTWCLIPWVRLVRGTGSQGSRNGKNSWGCSSQWVLALAGGFSQ